MPRLDEPIEVSRRALLSGASWNRRAGDSGVLIRMAARGGLQIKSP